MSKKKVGYCKPPEHSQFKKGQSGNPNGRPKGPSKSADDIYDVAYLFLQECEKSIHVTENGERVKIQMIQAVFKQALSKAAQGNMNAIRFVSMMFNRSVNLKHTDEKRRIRRGAKRLKNQLIENMTDDDIYDVLVARYEKQAHEEQTSDHGRADTADADGESMTEEEAMKAYMDNIQKGS